MNLLLLPNNMIKVKKVNKIRIMIKIKRWAMINGELSKMKMRVIKKSQYHHHSLIQELDKSYLTLG
jgi:hypothetical protein